MSASLGGASFFMAQAQMIQALVVMFNEDFEPTAWRLYLVSFQTTELQCLGVSIRVALTAWLLLQIYLACIIV